MSAGRPFTRYSSLLRRGTSDRGGPQRDEPSRVERGVGRGLTSLLGVLLISTAVGAVLWPHNPNLVYEHGLVVVGLLASLGIAVALVWARPRLPRGRVARTVLWAAAVVISLTGAWLGGWLADMVAYQYGWDAKLVASFSEMQHETGSLSPRALDYLSRYPNNVPLLAMMNLGRSVAVDHGTDMYTVYRIFNALCLGLALLLVFVLVRMLRGPWVALAAEVLTFVLVGCSPWMSVPYTDLPALPFVLGGACLVLAALRSQGRWLSLAALPAGGICFGVAYVIKSTPAAAAAGVALSLLVMLCTVRQWRRWFLLLLATSLSVATFFASAAVTKTVAFDQASLRAGQLDPSRTPPASWWAAMGLIPAQRWVGGVVYGGYNTQMVSESHRLRGPALQEWSDARLRTELDKFHGTGLLQYEAHKQLFNWGDGMFYAWGEGLDVEQPLLHHSPSARGVQAWNHGAGEHYISRASLTNGLWLAVVLWAGLGLLLSRYRRDLLALGLAVLGVMAFTLLFQGRSRYLFTYVPLLIALAASVDVPSETRRVVSRLNRSPGSTDAAGSELDGDPRSDRMARLGDRVIPRALARPAHDDEVTVTQREADRGATPARAQHEGAR